MMAISDLCDTHYGRVLLCDPKTNCNGHFDELHLYCDKKIKMCCDKKLKMYYGRATVVQTNCFFFRNH